MTGAKTTTFLFTDLVGSTEILDRLGDDAAAELLRLHFRILRETLAPHGGLEVKSLGDGLMVTFESAYEAIAAAIAMQQAIDHHNRDEVGPPLQMRVGIHAGEPLHTDDDYFGSVVVIARRLCDHAQGEQILVSSVVRDLVGRRGGFAFLGLGYIDLKGLSEPIEAHAVLWAKALEDATRSPQLTVKEDSTSKDVGERQIRILVVEDEPLWGELLTHSLSHEGGIEIVGLAQDGKTAVLLARELKPAAVLMDIELPGEMDGIEAALKIKQERPETGIVILSAHRDRRYVTSLPLSKEPGWAYLLKQSVPDTATVVRAIQASMSGMVMLDPSVVASLQPKANSALARLTRRELDVLRLLAEGYDNASIAERLVIAPNIADNDIEEIYVELGLNSEPGVDPRVRAAVLFLEETQLTQ